MFNENLGGFGIRAVFDEGEAKFRFALVAPSSKYRGVESSVIEKEVSDAVARAAKSRASTDEKEEKYVLNPSEFTSLDEETICKVMAIFCEMQMNIFNSQPIVIAKDVSYETVIEVETKSMMLSGIVSPRAWTPFSSS